MLSLYGIFLLPQHAKSTINYHKHYVTPFYRCFRWNMAPLERCPWMFLKIATMLTCWYIIPKQFYQLAIYFLLKCHTSNFISILPVDWEAVIPEGVNRTFHIMSTEPFMNSNQSWQPIFIQTQTFVPQLISQRLHITFGPVWAGGF